MKIFKDPIAPKEPRRKNDPWNFDCPQYDERSSCFVNAGSYYGVGHNQPVGHEGNPKTPGVPVGRPSTLEVGYVHRGDTGLVEVYEK